jgi:hypothetical protein
VANLPLGGVLGIFGQKVTGFDVAMTAVKGRASRTTGVDYTFDGIIQPAGDKAQAIAASGVKTDGQMILQTRKALYVVDVTQLGADVTSQSYIKYQGDVWRAFKVQGWSDKNTGITRYILARTVTATIPAVAP